VSGKTISEATRQAILDAALAHVQDRESLDFAQADIAAAAGVTRQTVFYAFGSRTGLLVAMVRHLDDLTDHVSRLRELSRGTRCDRELLRDYVDAYVDYLPLIYPVGVLLEAAALTDPAARAALDDRMKGALLSGFVAIMGRLAAAGLLAEGVSPESAAELAWSLVQFSEWRHLVVECGWHADAFRRSRHDLLERVLLAPARRSRR
jgi:AcrR family transcriptional regulator